MANIGDLVVNIKSNQSGLLSGITAAQAAVTAFAGVAVAAFIKVTRAISDSIDKIGNLSDEATKLGTSVPALQKLQYAAEQSGMSAGQMDSALKKLNITLGKAQGGGKAASAAFENLGLNASALANMSLDQKYIAISEAIKKLPTASQQAAAAMAIFGRAGTEQLVLINDDVKGLTEKFVSLGGTIDTQSAKSVENLGDKFKDAGVIWDGFINKITVAIAGPLTSLIEWSNNFSKSFQGSGKILSNFMEVIGNVTGINLLVSAITYLGGSVDSVIIKIEELLSGMLKIPKIAAATLGGLQEKLGLGESDTAQSIFNLDESIQSDIARRRKEMLEGPKTAANTAQTQKQDAKASIDVTVTPSADFQIRLTKAINQGTLDLLVKEAAASGIK